MTGAAHTIDWGRAAGGLGALASPGDGQGVIRKLQQTMVPVRVVGFAAVVVGAMVVVVRVEVG